jgi:hypothetical protein
MASQLCKSVCALVVVATSYQVVSLAHGAPAVTTSASRSRLPLSIEQLTAPTAPDAGDQDGHKNVVAKPAADSYFDPFALVTVRTNSTATANRTGAGAQGSTSTRPQSQSGVETWRRIEIEPCCHDPVERSPYKPGCGGRNRHSNNDRG